MSRHDDTANRNRIIQIVEERVAAIASGDQARIDSTYRTNDAWRRRNVYVHDYDVYCHVIEAGFGREVKSFDIYPLNAAPPLFSWEHLPFDIPPDYVVLLTTVDRRKTAWYVYVGVDQSPPRFMLPSFDGHFSDGIGMGASWIRAGADDRHLKVDDAADSVLRFDEDSIGAELAKRIERELQCVYRKVRLDKVRALAIDCVPYHSRLVLSLLTDRETFPADDEYYKWETEEWRFYDFPSMPGQHWPGAQDLIRHMHLYQNQRVESEGWSRTSETICRACAKALLHPRIRDAFARQKMQLADDFECAVFLPDDEPRRNYCAIILDERSAGGTDA